MSKWIYCHNGMMEAPTVVDSENNNRTIAEVYSCDADARLIAAAPELLKAAKRGLELIRNLKILELALVEFEIEAAVCKAEGI